MTFTFERFVSLLTSDVWMAKCKDTLLSVIAYYLTPSWGRRGKRKKCSGCAGIGGVTSVTKCHESPTSPTKCLRFGTSELNYGSATALY